MLVALLVGADVRPSSPDAGETLVPNLVDQNPALRCLQSSPKIPRLFVPRTCNSDTDCPTGCLCSCLFSEGCSSPGVSDGGRNYRSCISPEDLEARSRPTIESEDVIYEYYWLIVDSTVGDQEIVGPAGERNMVRRADGGFAILVDVPDAGYRLYHRPVPAPSAYLLRERDGGWTPVGHLSDGGIPGFPSQLINLSDAGWVSETPLLDGGVLRVPAATPSGY